RPGSGHVPGADGAARRLPARPEARCAEHNSIYACGACRCPGICRIRGIGSLISPSFGFIIGYIPAAFIAGLGAGNERGLAKTAGFGMLALLVIYVFGFLYFVFIMNQVIGTPVGLTEALMLTVVPFVI